MGTVPDSQECTKLNSFDTVNRNRIGYFLQRDQRSFGATRRGVEGCWIAVRARPGHHAGLGAAPGKTSQRGRARKEHCAKASCQPFCAFRICRSGSMQDLPRGPLQRLGEESALEDHARHERRPITPRLRGLPWARIGTRRWWRGRHQDICL